ncbi:hypothetical protein V8F20_011248 [Naviculisporaceae sp. PSN 640]
MSGNPHSIWKENRDLFHRLYLQENHSMEQVKVIAERDHNFPPHEKPTYETKLRDELKLRKNLKPGEWAAIGQHMRSQSTKCAVFICGVRRDDKQVKRYISRYRKTRASG